MRLFQNSEAADTRGEASTLEMKGNPMKEEQGNTPEKPPEPWKFYREVTAYEEAAIAETIRKNPGLTREEYLMEIEAAGF
jgi:hypothetical protein